MNEKQELFDFADRNNGNYRRNDARMIKQLARLLGTSIKAAQYLYDRRLGRCEGCGIHCLRQVDHNHDPAAPRHPHFGSFRNYLCGPCNRARGHAQESAARLHALGDLVSGKYGIRIRDDDPWMIAHQKEVFGRSLFNP